MLQSEELIKKSYIKKVTQELFINWTKGRCIDMKSERFTLNREDWKKWGRNALIFSSPLILLFLNEVNKGTPVEEVIILIKAAAFQLAIDLFKKWVAAN